MASHFVELPADEHGNTLMQKAVVQARVEERHGRQYLVPVAPDYFVERYPSGWRRDGYGGWVEVDGPARMLNYYEHKQIVEGLSSEMIEATPHNMVELRTGVMMSLTQVNATLLLIQQLVKSDGRGWYELVQLARNPQHQLWDDYKQVLYDFGLVQLDGKMHDLVRHVVVASAEGEDLELRLVSPIAA